MIASFSMAVSVPLLRDMAPAVVVVVVRSINSRT